MPAVIGLLAEKAYRVGRPTRDGRRQCCPGQLLGREHGGHGAEPDAADGAEWHCWPEGPDIVDVGGQSTRPGSQRVGPEEELRRVLPVIAELRRLDGHVPITIDTYHASVARAALAAGADGVNDISAGQFDPELLDEWPRRRRDMS